MKKFLNSLIIMFVFMFIGIINVGAASLTPNVAKVNASTTSRDYTFTITFSGTTNNEWKLTYDSEVYPSGSNPISNGNLSSDSGQIMFAVKKGLILNEDKNVNIKIANENSGEIVSTSIIILKNSDATTKQEQTTTTTTTQAPKSNNANLKSIVVKASDDSVVNLSPNFSPSLYEYEASVPSDVKTINIEAIMEDSKANVVISNNANDELIAGENNKITITVTAEDGTKKQYVVNVKREALTADATLSSLTIKEYKDLKFKSDKFNYAVKVKKSVNKLTLDYVLSDENSTVKVEGNEELKDGSKVKIIVTAEDGTKKVYTLQISKETEKTKETNNVVAEKNPLIIMGLSIIAFGLIGGIIYVIKK